MITIPLTKGYTAMIDDEDAERVNTYTWHAAISKGKVYATTNIKTDTGQKKLKLHHLIMGSNNRLDHQNGNSLDNRKENLRHSTAQQNSQNQNLRSDSSTGYKGVTKYYNKFRAQIFIYGKKKYLGLYDTPEQAAEAYNDAAIAHYKEYAKLNIIGK